MEKLVYTVTVILGMGALLISYLAFRKWKYAKQRQEGMEWLYVQLERALTQIQSGQVDEIKAGLQSIRALNVLSIRLRALPRLTELLTHKDPDVVALARDALENIYASEMARETRDTRAPKEKIDNALALG